MTLTRVLPALVFGLTCLAQGAALAQKAGGAATPQPPTTDDCLACHGDPSATGAGGRPVAVAPDRFAASVHGRAGVACVDCHTDLATAREFPHTATVAPVNCSACHPEPGRQYDASVHAEARRASARSVAAACKDCHGTHEIRSASDPESPTYHLNLAATCGRCHGSADIIRRGRIAIGNVVALFEDSIHGQALSRSGLISAPGCVDCHNAHDIRRRSDPASTVYRPTIPATCGRCHEGVQRRYQTGVHGQALAKGNPLAPVCVTCHTAHQIQRAEGAAWKQRVLYECGTCHAESIRTYRDTFHGQETRLGFMRVAACADCHGAHDLFPKADPRSTVSVTRVVATCRKCHPAATENFARYDPHADRNNRTRNPMLFFAAKFMEALLIGVFAFFGIHTALWTTRAVGPQAAGRGRRGEE